MKVLGINITFGDPDTRARRRAEQRADKLLEMCVRLNVLHTNKMDAGKYFPWWKNGAIDRCADWIIQNTNDDLTREILAKKVADYLRQREIDIELQNDELKRVVDVLLGKAK